MPAAPASAPSEIGRRVQPGEVSVPAGGTEKALLAFAERPAKHIEGRAAVHVRLSRLKAKHHRADHIRIAINAFRQDVQGFDGVLFELGSLDLVFIWRGTPADTVGGAVEKLCRMFADDPIGLDDDLDPSDRFVSWYRLDTDHRRFLSAVVRLVEAGEGKPRTLSPGAGGIPKRPLDPADLDGVVKSLGNADISNLVRNQPICALVGDRAPEPIYYERYVAIADLEAMLTPHLSLASDPWLFQYLTRTLDSRMIANFRRERDMTGCGIALNLNVSTVLGDDFSRLDADHGLSLRGRLVVEIHKIDMFSDIAAYQFARARLAERGYRVCMDGLGHVAFPLMDRTKLGLDLIKVIWDPAIATLSEDRQAEFRDAVKAAGPGRVILTRCGDAQAVPTGKALGISLFQGRCVDRLLRESRPAGERLGSLRVG